MVTNKFDHIFVVKLTNLLDKQGAVGPAKPADRPDHEVDDSLYLMTLTIPQLFLKPSQRHMIETSMRAGNAEVYGFLERQSIQRSRQSALKGLDDTPQPKSKAGASVIDKKEALSVDIA
ncbi:hypothetical protein HKD37_U058486 [Glycine soja]